MTDLTLLFIVLSTTLNGIAVGASLDQAIKQLPTRHCIGVVLILPTVRRLITAMAFPGMSAWALTQLFNRFARLHTLRTLVQALTFATLLWALVSFMR
jgi:hypothetical protein